MWLNPFPQKHHAFHIVAAYRLHTNDLAALNDDDWRRLGKAFSWVQEKYKFPGGALAIRFGNPRFNAGSIRHLHFNIQVPDGSGRVQITLAKEPEEILAKNQILRVFEKMRQGTSFENLSLAEQSLVRDRMQ